ncbi:MAG: hypothetical protein L3J20_10205 [Flavobacteriaceae bacterium]|nr:hypothetical protein [Flavobacteriaceae bacterium]
MKKIVTVIVFVFAIISLNACKSTSSCTSVEKQEINNNQIKVDLSTDVA